MSVIKDLWYGNICGVDDCCRYIAPDHTDFEAYEQLKKALKTEEQQQLLDAYVDAIHDAAMDWQEKAFTYGFRLGHDLALEIEASSKD